MSYDYDNRLSALRFICGECDQICRLCFCSTVYQEVSLQDTVIVIKPYCNETVTFSDMLGYLCCSNEPALPQVLCASCASMTINCYIFRKLCQYSNETWEASLETLTSSLSQVEVLSPNIHSTFLILNKSSHITLKSRKTNRTKSKKAALTHIKEIMESRNKYLKRKDKTNIVCEECGEKFSSGYLLARHKKIHKRFTCAKCTKIFSSLFHLKRHIERIHYAKKFNCNKCSKKLSTEKMLNYHIRNNHQPVICNLCFVQFPSRKSLKEHSDSHEVNTCPHCKKEFTNKSSFKVHVKKCGVDINSTFFCDLCDKGYINKNGIRSHLKTKHGFGKVVSCDWCGKKFSALNRLKSHIIKHTRERNFSCDQCGGLFVTRAALLYHSRLHTGERPYPCDLCNESFLSASRRTEHKKRKHIGPTKECTICFAKFVTSHQLHKHKARHYNPKSKLYLGKLVNTSSIICTVVDE